ncbi:hypothetical protein N9Y42_02245 [Mariniblastus sp.]|nr:hypothetical protein [Mariniblastus sp.]
MTIKISAHQFEGASGFSLVIGIFIFIYSTASTIFALIDKEADARPRKLQYSVFLIACKNQERASVAGDRSVEVHSLSEVVCYRLDAVNDGGFDCIGVSYSDFATNAPVSREGVVPAGKLSMLPQPRCPFTEVRCWSFLSD